jgi:hypothetical protein
MESGKDRTNAMRLGFGVVFRSARQKQRDDVSNKNDPNKIILKIKTKGL